MMDSTARRTLAGLLLTLTLCGCGGGVGDVSGVVTFKGKPVSGCTIVFFDAQNGSYTSPLQEDGNYAVAKVPAGAAKIAILMPMHIDLGIPGMKKLKFTAIPDKYQDQEKSGLTYAVQTGLQTKDFTLE